jgi:hypothetical protein
VVHSRQALSIELAIEESRGAPVSIAAALVDDFTDPTEQILVIAASTASSWSP